jgi:NADH-quinone oxidoreductase subunit N
MLVAAIQNNTLTGHHTWLVILAVLCAAISAYYYFRIIQAMYFKESNDAEEQVWDTPATFKLLLIITAVLIVGLGLFPNKLTDWLYYQP